MRLRIQWMIVLSLFALIKVQGNPNFTFEKSTPAIDFPDISGTWYINGDQNQVVTITQNGANLYFASSQYSSNARFVDDRKVYADAWNAYGQISNDLKTITWDNQVWNKQSGQAQNNLDLSGDWYVNGDAGQIAIITQNGNQLTFSSGGSYSAGSFYGSNQVYANDWNAYGNITDNGNTISWGNQYWNKAAVQAGRTQNYCRRELSLLYWMAQTLGTAWCRTASAPTFAGGTAQDVFNSLDYVQSVIRRLTCIKYRTENIELMVEGWAMVTKQQVIRDIEALIKELQTIIGNIDWQCDNNVNPVQLYIAGVHLGAAQAWASSEICVGGQIRADIQQTITAHLGTAQRAANNYAACIPDFDFGSFARMQVNSGNSTFPHTQIVGIETLLFWSVGMSDCCCRCTGAITPLNPVDSDRKCHDDCAKYCKSAGYGNGRWDGKSPCMLGQVTNKASGCKCY